MNESGALVHSDPLSEKASWLELKVVDAVETLRR